MLRVVVLERLRPLWAPRALGRSYATGPDEPDFTMGNPFEKEHPKCVLCKHNIQVDYKNVKLLSQFQSPYTGRIYGRHITRLCQPQQARVEAEIVKAQSAGMMATYLKEACYLEDPKLFDVENPIRPHRF
ncbi:28S ribosomal protein S18c, mitochondrial [Dendroctonus ponderosae]|uniref:28S ribosomal protein S18c, mitochondrial n=1 Tax=Dendroctonus ponderosae TaxID=77166 RepID=A0AAR5QE28_DENPD|nr:28S ribosomal protein S18c, mitochondrial [Dendroctonus ponderosae]KAH1000270.1 hypothetical protein HUJ04_000189 [Dendroctonus ponderosae]